VFEISRDPVCSIGPDMDTRGPPTVGYSDAPTFRYHQGSRRRKANFDLISPVNVIAFLARCTPQGSPRDRIPFQPATISCSGIKADLATLTLTRSNTPSCRRSTTHTFRGARRSCTPGFRMITTGLKGRNPRRCALLVRSRNPALWSWWGNPGRSSRRLKAE